MIYIYPPFFRLGRWQFATEGADIGFGVFLKNRKGEWKKAADMQEIVPSQRYNTHLVPEDGSLTCERPGVCECRPVKASGCASVVSVRRNVEALCNVGFSSLRKCSALPSDVLRFDNTYSIFQAKRVSFTIEVLLPDDLQSLQPNGAS